MKNGIYQLICFTIKKKKLLNKKKNKKMKFKKKMNHQRMSNKKVILIDDIPKLNKIINKILAKIKIYIFTNKYILILNFLEIFKILSNIEK